MPPAERGLTRRRLLNLGLGLAGAVGPISSGAGAYAAIEAAHDLNITHYNPLPQNWPTTHRLSITVVADLHAGGPNMGIARVRQVVDAANALGSDLVVVLGDYFATHRFITEHVPHAAWAGELARLKARFGVYAILGNHDWWYDIGGVRRALTQIRMPLLENDVVWLGEPGRKFWLAGIGDQIAYWLGRNHYRGVDDLAGTLGKVRTDDPVILLAHEPDIFPKVPPRVALTLAGHTHGGQIRVPFLEPVWTPSAFGQRFAYGHIVEGGRHMIVSGGLGTSVVPMRLGVPPEIVQIQLGV